MKKLTKIPKAHGRRPSKYDPLMDTIDAAEPGIYSIDWKPYGGITNVKNALIHYGYNVLKRGSELIVVVE